MAADVHLWWDVRIISDRGNALVNSTPVGAGATAESALADLRERLGGNAAALQELLALLDTLGGKS